MKKTFVALAAVATFAGSLATTPASAQRGLAAGVAGGIIGGAIVGGGIAGLSAAWHLGEDSVLLEPGLVVRGVADAAGEPEHIVELVLGVREPGIVVIG